MNNKVLMQADKSNKELNMFLANLPKAYESRSRRFVDSYKSLIDMIQKEDEAETGSIKPIRVKLPFESKDFKKKWSYWKDYLLETFDIKYSSRREQIAIEHLYKISDKKEENAIQYLDYAMTTGYRNFFIVTKNRNKVAEKGDVGNGDYD